MRASLTRLSASGSPMPVSLTRGPAFREPYASLPDRLSDRVGPCTTIVDSLSALEGRCPRLARSVIALARARTHQADSPTRLHGRHTGVVDARIGHADCNAGLGEPLVDRRGPACGPR